MNKIGYICTMKKRIPFILLVLLALAGCGAGADDVPRIILDTDMGNDIDDALALAAMNRYIDEGQARVLAIGMSKEGEAAADFTDIVQTWYGHGNIPIGRVSAGTGPKTTDIHYTDRVCALRDEAGAPLFAQTFENAIGALRPTTDELYRRVLAKQKDHSVTFVTVGFSTNMASLLATSADDISPLTGAELVARKVKQLVMMAGNMAEASGEFNVVQDIVAARKVFAEWPTPIVVSPFELGSRVKFPHTRVKDLAGGRQPNPVAEAYRFYLGPDYDACSWDPTALIYAVEGDGMFTVSEPGVISVDAAGITRFTPAPEGKHRYLIADIKQTMALTLRLVELTTTAHE